MKVKGNIKKCQLGNKAIDTFRIAQNKVNKFVNYYGKQNPEVLAEDIENQEFIDSYKKDMKNSKINLAVPFRHMNKYHNQYIKGKVTPEQMRRMK